MGSHSGSVTTTFCNGPFGSKFLIDKAADAKKVWQKCTLLSVSVGGGYAVRGSLYQAEFPLRKWHLFCFYDKYILPLGEIHLEIGTNTDVKWK